MIDCLGICWETVMKWMPQDLSDDKSALVQVMAWCRQATSHYLSQCWLRSMSPYNATRPQWVRSMSPYSATRPQWVNSMAPWRLGSTCVFLKVQCIIVQLIIQMRMMAHALSVKWLSGECHRTSVMISQHWFRWWLGLIRLQTIS